MAAELRAQREAAREAARSQGLPYASVLDLGIRWSAGAPMPHLFNSSNRTMVLFYRHVPRPDWDGSWATMVDPREPAPAALGLIEFIRPHSVRFGGPNDEALHGHPLSDHGLEPYEAHEVHNSQWIAEAERINSVHPAHQGGWHDRMRHYILSFHDDTLECLAHDVRVEQFECPFPEAVARVARLLLA
ncbi:hypothetical protein [Streptomyces sp. NPDC017958]|uniref:hypothetical protein n=1 Tax=Streptomyces sp. NPDC017958 TaxID=3365021 RepID=UPI00378E118C